jgi:hypothetical protein
MFPSLLLTSTPNTQCINSVRGYSTELRSSLATPLTAYAQSRLHTRQNTSYLTNKVSLSSLAGPTPIPGPTGNGFNASIVLKHVPLAPLYHPTIDSPRSTRKMTIYSKRYDPSLAAMEPLDSVVNIAKYSHRQRKHFLDRENEINISKLKMAYRHKPHQIDYGFYMSGHTVNVHKRAPLALEEFNTLAREPLLSENQELFYGKLAGLNRNAPFSRSFKRLKVSNHGKN